MKKLLLITLLYFSFCSGIIAQDNKISVLNFYLSERDLTANTHGNIVYDQNGEKCALIKIITNIDGFSFDVGVLGVVETHQKPGEYWVYVPHGVRKISISHPIYEHLEYNLPQSTQRGSTYKMLLSSKEIFDNIVDDNTKTGHLQLEVFPPEASVTINAIHVGLDSNGKATTNMYYGRYTYQISAENYHPAYGKVTINSTNSNPKLKIRLKQNFGWLQLKGKDGIDSTATVFIDGKLIPSANYDSIQVLEGVHTIRIENPLFNTFFGDFTIKDSTVVPLDVALVPNFGTVRFNADSTTQIWCNGKLLGKGNWEGRLPAGRHTIEYRKEGHKSSSKEIAVNNATFYEHTLAAPVPLYGAIEIYTNPDSAEVYIDGVFAGHTPIVKRDVLSGKRNITLKLPNYAAKSTIMEVVEGEMTEAMISLDKWMAVTINSYPQNSSVQIDGIRIGTTPLTDTIMAGEHHIHISSPHYNNRPIDKTINITKDNTTLEYYHQIKNRLYLEMLQYLESDDTWGGAVGGYINKFNFEAGLRFSKMTATVPLDEIINTGQDSGRTLYYTPNDYWLKFGYEIRISRDFAFTPQVGARVMFLKLKDADSYDFPYGDQSNNISCIIAGRISWTFPRLNRLGLSITPEYRIPVQKSKAYRILSNSSTDIKDFGTGPDIKLGFFFYF